MNTNYIVNERGTGKTRALLEFAVEKNAVVICSSEHSMRRKAEAYGLFGVRCISYAEVLRRIHDCDTLVEPFVIDEIGDFARYLLASNCVGFTQTVED